MDYHLHAPIGALVYNLSIEWTDSTIKPLFKYLSSLQHTSAGAHYVCTSLSHTHSRNRYVPLLFMSVTRAAYVPVRLFRYFFMSSLLDATHFCCVGPVKKFLRKSLIQLTQVITLLFEVKLPYDPVCLSVGWSAGWSVIFSLKKREVSLSTLLFEH